jgi:magnesium-transporting ATPase (P-type)
MSTDINEITAVGVPGIAMGAPITPVPVGDKDAVVAKTDGVSKGQGFARTVGVRDLTQNLDEKQRSKYVDNILRSNHYPSWLLFLPINLVEQYSKAANMFFLIIIILAAIPAISAFSPYSTIMAVMFINTIQAAKDGYEDYQRHVRDEKENQTQVSYFPFDSGKTKFEKTECANLRPGDFIKIEQDK